MRPGAPWERRSRVARSFPIGGLVAARLRACQGRSPGAPRAGSVGWQRPSSCWPRRPRRPSPRSARPSPPITLPERGGARAAASTGWIVGARPGAAADRIARRHGARLLRLPGAYLVEAGAARGLAAALRRRGLLRFAEANAPRRRMSSFDGQLGAWARAAVVSPLTTVPGPTVAIGVIDDLVEPQHPDLAGRVAHVNPGPIIGPHGTMVASAAAGAVNGAGVTGIFPGAPIVSYGVPEPFGCAESADGILALAVRRVPIVNASYGSPSACYTEYSAIVRAYAAGTMVVAAAGNEFQEGNPVIFPAAWPHVLSVGALDVDLSSSYFSNENAALDVSAPGQAVPLAIPVQFDTDGVADGVTVADGTSFAAPIVAGAAAWIRAARPNAANGQVADLLRRTARDVGPAGWDPSTGFGLVNLERALAAPLPRLDPLEPNDTIGEVDGTVFGANDPSVWKGKGRTKLSASVDSVEDPVDVYRLRIPRRARFSILLHPNTGDPDLAIFRRAARSLSDTRHVVAQSARGEGRTDAVRLVNDSGTTRTVYVVVYVPDEARFADSSYRLEFERKSRR